MQLERQGEAFTIAATLLGDLLNMAPADVLALVHENQITSICERGEGEDEGKYRLTFFYKGRRARLSVDRTGKVLRRSIIDTGERRMAASR